MKDFIEKVLLYLVPFLVVTSICYNNGYWSLYPINIYEYYQATDIIKAIAMPAFSFISLASFPLLITGIIAYLSLKANNSTEENLNKPSEETKTSVFAEKIFDKLGRISLLNKRVFYIPVTIILLCVFLCGFGYALMQAGIGIWKMMIELSPYSDEKNFIKVYFNIYDRGTLRSIQACVFVPMIFVVASFMIHTSSRVSTAKAIKSAVKTFAFTFSIALTFALAYNAGRIDAYKIISGYDFYYSIDSNNEPHKYLGKLDKYFFFLDDNRIIKNEKLTSLLVGKLPYSTRISIISEDSLKALQLHRYNLAITNTDSNYYKIFRIRKTTD